MNYGKLDRCILCSLNFFHNIQPDEGWKQSYLFIHWHCSWCALYIQFHQRRDNGIIMKTTSLLLLTQSKWASEWANMAASVNVIVFIFCVLMLFLSLKSNSRRHIIVKCAVVLSLLHNVLSMVKVCFHWTTALQNEQILKNKIIHVFFFVLCSSCTQWIYVPFILH